jgi:hypothetical protein
MLIVDDVLNLHEEMVSHWHKAPIDQTSITGGREGILATICQQHAYNFQLWHEEDKARTPNASDKEIANVKRTIDGLNQKRNDWIEQIDVALQEFLDTSGVRLKKVAIKCTETPGAAIDRLSVLSLRLYHLQEELCRPDVDKAHKEKVRDRFDVCLQQQANLAEALELLWKGISAGSIAHRVFRQLKMYNDPTLNPAIYSQNKTKRAA